MTETVLRSVLFNLTNKQIKSHDHQKTEIQQQHIRLTPPPQLSVTVRSGLAFLAAGDSPETKGCYFLSVTTDLYKDDWHVCEQHEAGPTACSRWFLLLAAPHSVDYPWGCPPGFYKYHTYKTTVSHRTKFKTQDLPGDLPELPACRTTDRQVEEMASVASPSDKPNNNPLRVRSGEQHHTHSSSCGWGCQRNFLLWWNHKDTDWWRHRALWAPEPKDTQ